MLELHRGQVSERFTEAIEQLSNSSQAEVRNRGIYALDQIGRDSEDLHWPIVEVLADFIREHAIRRCCRGPEEVVGVVAPSGRPHSSAASCSRPTVEDLGHRLENSQKGLRRPGAARLPAGYGPGIRVRLQNTTAPKGCQPVGSKETARGRRTVAGLPRRASTPQARGPPGIPSRTGRR